MKGRSTFKDKLGTGGFGLKPELPVNVAVVSFFGTSVSPLVERVFSTPARAAAMLMFAVSRRVSTIRVSESSVNFCGRPIFNILLEGHEKRVRSVRELAVKTPIFGYDCIALCRLTPMLAAAHKDCAWP